MTTLRKVQIFMVVLICGFLSAPRVMVALARLNGDSRQDSVPQVAEQVPQQTQNSSAGTPHASPYESMHLLANGIYVWDISQGKKLYGQNEHIPLPLASVTKMMMAVVAKESLPANSEITITQSDIASEGDSGLIAGERWSFSKLLQFTLTMSSNDGASAIASVAGAEILHATTTDALQSKKMFIQKMNDKARAIGLDDTHFSNESGLDVGSMTAGATGSARDMAILFEYVFRKYPELFTSTTYAHMTLSSQSNVVHHVLNTNQDVARISGVIGSKTGYTDLAGGNLVVVVDIGINHPVIIAVLGSTRDGRFSDTEQLITATIASITDSQNTKEP